MGTVHVLQGRDKMLCYKYSNTGHAEHNYLDYSGVGGKRGASETTASDVPRSPSKFGPRETKIEK